MRLLSGLFPKLYQVRATLPPEQLGELALYHIDKPVCYFLVLRVELFVHLKKKRKLAFLEGLRARSGCTLDFRDHFSERSVQGS